MLVGVAGAVGVAVPRGLLTWPAEVESKLESFAEMALQTNQGPLKATHGLPSHGLRNYALDDRT
ncbi:hypothetical protein COLO4_14053 [Corchorus olitorius]|uniref:Uncharacterized protein n=1 Tax=Corchorus olitorius TaxID=93759 RepID=A0A1R3JU08_9ROSI|nr:hypothetical protein COLO4_14053 [Corchorus olitorius]